MPTLTNAKQQALNAYPTDKDEGVRFLLDALDLDEEDFTFEFNLSPEEYIYNTKEDRHERRAM